MEILSTVGGLVVSVCMFICFLKWVAKRDRENVERRSQILGQYIAEAIKSSVEEMKK